MPRPLYQPAPRSAKPNGLLASWRRARFSSEILFHSTNLYSSIRFSRRNRTRHSSTKSVESWRNYIEIPVGED